jgi:hypothetical protein
MVYLDAWSIQVARTLIADAAPKDRKEVDFFIRDYQDKIKGLPFGYAFKGNEALIPRASFRPDQARHILRQLSLAAQSSVELPWLPSYNG